MLPMAAQTLKSIRSCGVALAVALGLAAAASAGDLTVGAGSTLDLGTGSLALGCADLDVTGTLTAGTRGLQRRARRRDQPGGTVNGNSATLSLAGDWDNAGTFNAGTSTVEMVDGCALFSGVVAGNTSFANLSDQHHHREAGELHRRLDPDRDGPAHAARRRGQPAPDPQHA